MKTFPMDRVFYADLVMPDGYREGYAIEARNKTEARKRIAELYRRDTPPKSAGFYSFSQGRIVWTGEG